MERAALWCCKRNVTHKCLNIADYYVYRRKCCGDNVILFNLINLPNLVIQSKNRKHTLILKFLKVHSAGPSGRAVRQRSAVARLLRLWVRIPPGAWMFFCSECCVLSGRGLCDGLITRPEESYRLWCVVVCDLEKPQEWGEHSPRLGCKHHKKSPFYSIRLFWGLWLFQENIMYSAFV